MMKFFADSVEDPQPESQFFWLDLNDQGRSGFKAINEFQFLIGTL